jgi:hypothetical protein
MNDYNSMLEENRQLTEQFKKKYVIAEQELAVIKEQL